MANEISMVASLTCSKSGTTVTGTSTKLRNLDGTGMYANTQSIGTSAETLTLPSDLTTEGVSSIWLKNTDATNFVEFALDSGMTNKFARLSAGEAMNFRPASGNPTIYARADTAAVAVQLVAVGT